MKLKPPLQRGAWISIGLGVVLVAAVLAIYAHTTGFRFVMFDDDNIIYLNPMLCSPDLRFLTWIVTEAGRMPRYLPVGWLGFSCVFAAGGLDPAWWHATSFGIHALNAVLAFAVFGRLLPQRSPGGSPDDTAWRAWCGAAGAAFWALHPLRVESVTWVSAQLYPHATAWALVSTLAFQVALERRNEGRSYAGSLAVSALACAASLFTYPLAFGLPVVLAVIALAKSGGERDGNEPRRSRWRILGLVAPHLVLAVVVLGMALSVRIGHVGPWKPVASTSTFGVGARLAQASYLVVRYIGLTVFPIGLTPADDLLQSFDPVSTLFIGSVALALGLSAAAWFLRRRLPAIGWLWLAYLALLAPFMGFLEHPYYPCDRYTYLPGLVLAAGVTLGLGVIGSSRGRVAALGATLVLAGVYSSLSYKQTAIWRDNHTLFGRIVRRARGERLRVYFEGRLAWSDVLLGNTTGSAVRLARLVAAHPGDPDLAAIRRRIADLETPPANGAEGLSPVARELQRMALQDAKSGRLYDAEQRLRYALSLSPTFAEARYNLAVILAQRGLPIDASAEYLWATAPGSGLQITQLNRVKVLALIARAFERAGQVRWALACGTAGRSAP